MANTYQLTQTGPQVQADLDAVEAGDIVYLTSAPSADNTSGKLKIVVLEEEPSTKYEGYIYIIKENAPITDLTGTKWRIKKPSEFVFVGEGGSTISSQITYKMYASTYESAEQNNLYIREYGSVLIMVASTSPFVYPRLAITGDFSNTSPTGNVQYQTDSATQVNLGDIESTIKITGGTDVTNTELINWLQANATQIPANQVSLISFTINGTSYQAEEDMTWTEWCNSEYNTSGCYISGDSVVKDGGATTIIASPNDVIVANNVYTTIHSGGSND